MTILTGDILFYTLAPGASVLDRSIGAVELVCGQVHGQSLAKRIVGAGALIGNDYEEGTAGIAYHMSLAQGGNLQVEAVWPRVQSSRFDPSDPSIQVYRVIGATQDECNAAVAAARARVGEWYDLGELCFGLVHEHHMEICSQLVEDAWCRGSHTIWPQSDRWPTPEKMIQSGAIARVLS